MSRQIYEKASDGAKIIDDACLPLLGILHISFETNLHDIEVMMGNVLITIIGTSLESHRRVSAATRGDDR